MTEIQKWSGIPQPTNEIFGGSGIPLPPPGAAPSFGDIDPPTYEEYLKGKENNPQ